MIVKKEQKNEKNTDFARHNLLRKKEFPKLKELYTNLRKKYDDLPLTLQRKELFLPDYIFNKKLSSLEAISKYLIEDCDLSIKEASNLLSRTNKNIWYAYNSSKKKLDKFSVKKTKFLIPTSVVKNLHLGVLESIVFYLKDEVNLPFHKIADILERDDRTVYTAYKKAKSKGGIKNKNEVKKFKEISELFYLFSKFSQKFNPSFILAEFEKDPFIPLSILSNKLGILEAVTKFLVENYNLSISEICSLLDRDYASIWNAYNSSKKKVPDKFSSFSNISIPLSIFKNRELVESLVVYLKEVFEFSYHKIALLLNRDDRTIWTVYQRAKKKK